MEEIDLSIMDRGAATQSAMLNMLAQFEGQYRVHVHLHILPWTAARQELVKFGLYANGPDVSEIGTTWVSDLIAMNTLRMFTPLEVDQCRGNDDYLPASLECTRMAGETDTWAIPWLTETVLLHYRKYLCSSAGINPEKDFNTLTQLNAAAQKLATAGVSIPIALPTKIDRPNLVQDIASWIWRAGGDFINRDGSQVLIDQPEFIAGVRSFCDLYRTLSKDGRKLLEESGIWGAVHHHNAAMAIGGMWVSRPAPENPDSDVASMAVTRLPGIPFVGGSNLVIWRSSRKQRAAFDLVNFLSTSPSIIAFARQTSMLPSHIRAINSPEISETPAHSYLVDSLKAGRSFPAVRLWGIIEERLGTALASILSQVLANQDTNLDDLITTTLTQTARNINRTLTD